MLLDQVCPVQDRRHIALYTSLCCHSMSVWSLATVSCHSCTCQIVSRFARPNGLLSPKNPVISDLSHTRSWPEIRSGLHALRCSRTRRQSVKGVSTFAAALCTENQGLTERPGFSTCSLCQARTFSTGSGLDLSRIGSTLQ